MSVTYTDETNDRPLNSDAPYVPAYARSRQSRKSKGGIKTWMILAPIGVLAVGGVGAVMLMNGGEQTQMAEAEATTPAPIISQPLSNDVATAPMTSSAAAPAPVEVTPTPASTPVARAASPEREAAPVRRAAPRVAAPVTPRVEEAPVLSGPQPYSAAPSTPTSSPTSTLNRAPVTPAPAPAPTPATPAAPAPVIVVQPAG